MINYWNPSEYYTERNKQDAGFLMFWERVSEVRQSKMITAEIELRQSIKQAAANGSNPAQNTMLDFKINSML